MRLEAAASIYPSKRRSVSQQRKDAFSFFKTTKTQKMKTLVCLSPMAGGGFAINANDVFECESDTEAKRLIDRKSARAATKDEIKAAEKAGELKTLPAGTPKPEPETVDGLTEESGDDDEKPFEPEDNDEGNVIPPLDGE